MSSQTEAESSRGPIQGQEPWSVPVFGCFGDFRVCFFTFLCPCYTLARNAAYFGEDGVVMGLFYALGLTGLGAVTRWRIRSEKNIRGSMLMDAVLHFACPCCALIQENRELYGFYGSHLGEKIPIADSIERQ